MSAGYKEIQKFTFVVVLLFLLLLLLPLLHFLFLFIVGVVFMGYIVVVFSALIVTERML